MGPGRNPEDRFSHNEAHMIPPRDADSVANSDDSTKFSDRKRWVNDSNHNFSNGCVWTNTAD